jgi:hypothetical protein
MRSNILAKTQNYGLAITDPTHNIWGYTPYSVISDDDGIEDYIGVGTTDMASYTSFGSATLYAYGLSGSQTYNLVSGNSFAIVDLFDQLEFNRLLSAWLAERGATSSITKMAMCPSYGTECYPSDTSPNGK